MSNISKAFIHEAPDLLRINLSSESTNEEVVSQLPGSTIVDASRHIFSVPYGRVDDYGKLASKLPGVSLPRTVPLEKPEISFRYYLCSLKDLLHDYSHGDLGLIRTGDYVIQVKSILTETIIRTCTY
jgi:oligopeptide transport system permease protein